MKRDWKKLVWQKKYWLNSSKRKNQFKKRLNSTALLPESKNNILTAVDKFDVPEFEKPLIRNNINNVSLKNDQYIKKYN